MNTISFKSKYGLYGSAKNISTTKNALARIPQRHLFELVTPFCTGHPVENELTNAANEGKTTALVVTGHEHWQTLCRMNREKPEDIVHDLIGIPDKFFNVDNPDNIEELLNRIRTDE